MLALPLFSLSFLMGILFLYPFSYLPDKSIGIIILAGSLVGFFLFAKRMKYIIGCLLGFAWVILFTHWQTAWTLPSELEGKTLQVKGVIASIPKTHDKHSRFLFSLDEVQSQTARGLLRLSWQQENHTLHPGQRFEFSVRLKRIHGTRNPGGFDYEAWSLHEGIRAQGYVVIKGADPPKLLPFSAWQSLKYLVHHIRHYYSDTIASVLPSSKTSHWITALAIGERDNIPREQWQVLRRTGTNHLMAIAGLHIGFMSAFAFGLFSWCVRRLPRVAWILPAQHAGGIAALLIALIYSALAGFSIPTQRACLMLSSVLIVVLMRRRISLVFAFSLALLMVLLLNPLSVLTESFWLSFGSVALIIYGMKGRLAPKGLWWKHGRIQWVIAVGLIPLSIWLFQECSLISFVANSIAIPIVGFLIVPITLAGCFLLLLSEKVGGSLLLFADLILQYLWMILEYLAQLSWGSWHHFVPGLPLLLAFTGMILLLLPSGFPGRWFGILWLLPLVLYKPPVPSQGEAWFTLLDVGQGLSAVIQTQHHLLIFDTGAKLSENFDMGESVVLPFLRTLQAKKIDMLVVSHGDNDHSGGVNAILQELPVIYLKTSVPSRFSLQNATLCLKGQHFQWDGVDFTFLHPTTDLLTLGNNSSCVLKVSIGTQSILLTGDIEKFAENILVETGANIAAQILIAPHHGSKTSGESAFIQKVNPEIVLYPIGYRNRYHFPHPSVSKKYEERGVKAYDTAKFGAIHFKIDGKTALAPDLYRVDHKHYWND